ncbi:Pre-mRNA-splicing factor CWC22 [Rhodotorula toruloides]|nr:Pre-mRNA-splicing factor CWC22 [Rhodotorula toruloides]
MSRDPSPRRERSASPADSPRVSRKRSPESRSPSPPARRVRPSSPGPAGRDGAPSLPRLQDVDPVRLRERERQMRAMQEAEGSRAPISIKPKVDPAAEVKKMALTRGGGTYIPPHRLRAMMAEQAQDDQEGEDYQRLTWEALRKSINGLINKVNTANIKLIVPQLFGENLIRGKGLFVRSVMRAQASSLPFTPIFASLVAIINTKLPQVGELLLHRLIHQFRRSYKRNDKPTMTATTTFLAHLVNQQVAHEVLALQMLVLLLERPTDDSVEIAVSFMREVGAFLAEHSARANNGIFDRFRTILNESGIDKRVQYMVEVLFQVRKDKYKDNPIIPEGLDLVEEEDMITHRISLDDEVTVQETLNIFKFDPNFKENEEAYAEIKREILGDSDDEEGSGDEGDTEEGSDEESEIDDGIKADGTVDVHDQTGANLVNLRRTIYLTIMSALDFEEATHKLLKLDIAPGQEVELCNMVIECCSQERTFSKFYGLMGERFCKINQVWATAYEQCFVNYYATIHRYETNRLRNIARFFGHLLMTDAMSWTVLEAVKMNEDDTTSSSRIFVKILFQEMLEGMGLKRLVDRFKDESLQPYLGNVFPIDNPKNTRFSINFFTAIGLGAITENMREHLKKMPALLLEQQRRAQVTGGGASSSSDSDSSSSLSSSSLSESSDYSSDDSRYPRRKSSRRSPSPRRGRSRSRSYDSRDRSRSRSRARSYDSRSRSRTPSRSPPPRRGGGRDRSPPYSRSPPPRSTRRRSPSYSRSPPTRRRGDSPPRRRDQSPTPPPRDSAPKRDFRHPDRRFDDDDRRDGPSGGGGGGGRDFRHPDRRFDGPPAPPRGGGVGYGPRAGAGGGRERDGGWGARR